MTLPTNELEDQLPNDSTLSDQKPLPNSVLLKKLVEYQQTDQNALTANQIQDETSEEDTALPGITKSEHTVLPAVTNVLPNVTSMLPNVTNVLPEVTSNNHTLLPAVTNNNRTEKMQNSTDLETAETYYGGGCCCCNRPVYYRRHRPRYYHPGGGGGGGGGGGCGLI